MQLIGDKIRTLRRKRGLSQEQLGEMVHFSQSKISKIERGEGGDWDVYVGPIAESARFFSRSAPEK
jgi:transcriptional regulator with XRE-family HTH domain